MTIESPEHDDAPMSADIKALAVVAVIAGIIGMLAIWAVT